MKSVTRRFALALAGAAGLAALAMPALAQSKFYEGAPRTYLYNPEVEVCFKDTSQYKKDGPYTIGFSNAGLGDSWRVVMLHSLQTAAANNKDQIERLLITDAGHDEGSAQLLECAKRAFDGHARAL